MKTRQKLVQTYNNLIEKTKEKCKKIKSEEVIDLSMWSPEIQVQILETLKKGEELMIHIEENRRNI